MYMYIYVPYMRNLEINDSFSVAESDVILLNMLGVSVI